MNEITEAIKTAQAGLETALSEQGLTVEGVAIHAVFTDPKDDHRFGLTASIYPTADKAPPELRTALRKTADRLDP